MPLSIPVYAPVIKWGGSLEKEHFVIIFLPLCLSFFCGTQKKIFWVFLCPVNEGWCGPLLFWTPFTFIIWTKRVTFCSRYLLSCSREFGTTRGWVNDDRFSYLGRYRFEIWRWMCDKGFVHPITQYHFLFFKSPKPVWWFGQFYSQAILILFLYS